VSKKKRTKGLYEKVKAFILVLTPAEPKFTKESLAGRFKVRQHEISEILARLNKEGLVYKPTHSQPHRRVGDQRCCWGPDVYTRRFSKQELMTHYNTDD
jgi:transcription initiation factor IIE alpha subunit